MQEQLALTLAEGHQIIFGVLFMIVVLVFPGGLVEAWNWLRRRCAPGGPRARATPEPDARET